MVELISYRHSRHLLWPSLWHADPTLGLLVVPADVPEAADGHDPGGICGVLTPVGGIGLLMRRLTNPRIRATSTTADILILCILLIQCALGLTTIPFSAQHPDGSEMLKLVDWAQAVVTFHGGASAHLDGVAWIYRVHGARNDHLSDLPLHPAGSRLERAGGIFTRRYRVVRSRR